MSWELYVMFLSEKMGVAPEEVPPFKSYPDASIELLWPFLQIIQKPDVAAYVRRAPYDPAGEAPFDHMLERLAADPEGEFHNRGNNAVLTVWSERVKQAIIVLQANMASNTWVLTPPFSLDEQSRQVAAALLWLHRMELPFHPGTTRPR